MDESIALVEFSKHSEKVWSEPFDYAHIEVGLKIWNPHRRVDEAFAWPAIAEAYHAVDRGNFVGTCGTADRPPKLRVAIHVRLGDLKVNDRGARDAAEALRASLRVAADLEHREAATKGRVHVLVVSDSSAAEIVAALARAPSKRQRPVAVERPARRWSDGVSHFEEAATSGLRPGDLTLTFLGAGNPLVALDCLASANVVLSPCVTPRAGNE